MPNRVIRDGFLDSPRVDALDWFAECVYHRLLLAVDDAGRIDGRSSVLKSRLFPLKDRLRASDVERGVNQLEEQGLVVRWEVGDQVVIQVTRWRRCGNAQYSRYPDPDGNFEIRYVEVQTRDGPVQMVASSLMTPPSHPNTPRSHPDPAEHPHQRWESKIDVSHTDPIQTPSASHPYTKTETETKTYTKTGTKTDVGAEASALRPEAELALGSGPAPSENSRPSGDQAFLVYPTRGTPPEFVLTSRQVEHFEGLYMGIDVRQELLKALAWLEASPERRKTARGMPRFLVNWLNRAVDYARNGKGKTGPATGSCGLFEDRNLAVARAFLDAKRQKGGATL